MHRFLTLLSLVAIVMTSVVTASLGVELNPKRGGEIAYRDRADILDLFSRYSQYIDAHQGEAFASLFTPDGELTFTGVNTQGHDRLAAFANRPPGDRIGMHFIGSTVLVEVAPGHVHARSMVIVASEDPKIRNSASGIGFGIYLDDIVKTPQGWRFANRQADMTLPTPPEFLN